MPVVRLLATDGGPHSAADLAEWTAIHVMDVFATAPGLLYADAMQLQGRIAPALVDLLDLVQNDERARLSSDGPMRLLEPVDINDVVAEGVRRIQEIAGEVRPDPAALAACLRSTFHHTAWIERGWYTDACHSEPAALAFYSTTESGPKDEHKNHPAALAFRAHLTHGHALLQHPEEALSPFGGRKVVGNLLNAANPHHGVEG